MNTASSSTLAHVLVRLPAHVLAHLPARALVRLVGRITLTLAALTLSVAALADANSIVGTWLTDEGDSKVEVKPCGDAYCGTIVWLKNPNYAADHELAGQPLMDRNNDDESQQTRPIMGLNILSDLKYNADDNRWEDGQVYSPRKGESYDAEAWIEDGKLMVEGSVMFFSKTVEWTRAD